MKTHHTPGPWEIDLSGDITASGWLIARVWGSGEDGIECGELQRGNENLIAAAPDYDAAAKAIFRAVESNAAPMNVEYVLRQMMVEGKRIELDTDLLLNLFAAIAKAEGRP